MDLRRVPSIKQFMDRKKLNCMGDRSWFKNNYRSKPCRTKIKMLDSNVFNVLAEYSEKKDFIELNFKDGNGKEKFRFTIIEVGNKGKFDCYIHKINKVSRPKIRLEKTKVLNDSLEFSGQWKPSKFDNIIHIDLCHKEQKPYIIKLIMHTYEKYGSSKDPGKFWMKDEIDEYYIFKRPSKDC